MSWPKSLAFKRLRALAGECLLQVVGFTDLAPLTPERSALESWIERGYAGELKYLTGKAGSLLQPAELNPLARSMVCFAVAHAAQAAPPCPPGFGRVARYAGGVDYHQVIPERLKALLAACEEHLGASINARICCDAVPLLERAAARRAALGFIGKNSMLIRPGRGSFSLLAEIVWDVEIDDGSEISAASAKRMGQCGNCSRCLAACPTQAIVAERVVDVRRCISYLTIEKKGELSWEERGLLGAWVFGCDVCQEVCPFNHGVVKQGQPAEMPELNGAAGVGPLLDLKAVLAIRLEREFKRVFSGSPLLRAKRAGLLRNAAVVAANTRAFQTGPVLLEAFEQDPSGLVRQHALWAWHVLGDGELPKTKLKAILQKGLGDADPGVQREAQALLDLG